MDRFDSVATVPDDPLCGVDLAIEMGKECEFTKAKIDNRDHQRDRYFKREMVFH